MRLLSFFFGSLPSYATSYVTSPPIPRPRIQDQIFQRDGNSPYHANLENQAPPAQPFYKLSEAAMVFANQTRQALYHLVESITGATPKIRRDHSLGLLVVVHQLALLGQLSKFRIHGSRLFFWEGEVTYASWFKDTVRRGFGPNSYPLFQQFMALYDMLVTLSHFDHHTYGLNRQGVDNCGSDWIAYFDKHTEASRLAAEMGRIFNGVLVRWLQERYQSERERTDYLYFVSMFHLYQFVPRDYYGTFLREYLFIIGTPIEFTWETGPLVACSTHEEYLRWLQVSHLTATPISRSSSSSSLLPALFQSSPQLPPGINSLRKKVPKKSHEYQLRKIWKVEKRAIKEAEKRNRPDGPFSEAWETFLDKIGDLLAPED